MSKLSARRTTVAGAVIILGSLALSGSAFAAGANTSGAYDANYTGAASGNGGGMASLNAGDHLPLAGSVGNADNMNPPGQLPDGTDANAGYECDTNQGVGLTNPAHTGCEPSSGL
jgi:hypothetical protein